MQTGARESVIELLWVFGILLSTIWLLRPISIDYAGTVALILTMGIATWRLGIKGLSWKDAGISRPTSLPSLANAVVGIFVLALVLGFAATSILKLFGVDQSSVMVNTWTGLESSLLYFLFRLVLAWITSFSEEFIFRGLLITWLDRILGGNKISLTIAVVLQACLSGYLHYETQGLYGSFAAGGRGLAMGIGYVVCKKNLWPVIIVHVGLNTIALTELYLNT